MFGLAFAIAGRPPGPEELARMTLRGIIEKDGTGAGATTFQQGIAESDVKTKWTDPLWQLAQYVPPPDAIGSLYEKGAITKDQAVGLWQQDGVPEALAQGYAYIAEQQHIGQDKLLARGQVLTGFYDGLFSNEQATDLLADLGYTGQVAADLLGITGFRREIQAINSVVRRVLSAYGSNKLTAAAAMTALTAAGVQQEQAGELLGTWEVLRESPIRVPTVAEIGGAVKYGTLTQPEAISELEALGYEPRDAAIVLSAHAEAQVTPLPPAGSTVTG
jgi:hypothetical protein